jgi:clan AA aspartic protease (TIGR02281 family)
MLMLEPHEDRYGLDRRWRQEQDAVHQPKAVSRAGIAKILFGDLDDSTARLVSVLIGAVIIGVAALVVGAGHPSQPHHVAVLMQRAGGVFVVPATLNGAIMIGFVIDSGASEVSVPLDVFWALRSAGTIRDADMLDSAMYSLADGSKSEQVRFTIRQIRVGSVVLNDVPATVSPQGGGALLGQSFLGAFKAWSIDNRRHVLKLVY